MPGQTLSGKLMYAECIRVFTEKEEAENHCNVGNGKLAIDEILS